MATSKVQRSHLTWTTPPTEQDFYSYLLKNFYQNLDAPALIDVPTAKVTSFRDVIRLVDVIARQLLRHGFKRGQCLGLYSVNCVEYTLVVLATLRLGGHVGTINCQLTTDEARTLIDLCDAAFLFTSKETAGRGIQAADGSNIKVIFCRDEYPGCVSYSSLLENLPSVSLPSLSFLNIRPAEETAAILFSSGTTGPQKAVMLSHKNFVYETSSMIDPHFSIPGPHNLIFVPMSHLMGFGLTLWSIAGGNCALITHGFNPRLFLDIAVKYKTKSLHFPPPIAVFLAKSPMVAEYDLSFVETIITGAAPLSAELEREVSQRLGGKNIVFSQMYGMTENCGLVTGPCLHNRPLYLPPAPDGSVGLLFPEAEIRVVDTKTGDDLGPDEDGELWIKGPYNMLGYQKNREQTKQTIDKDGWLHTGDIGHYDKHGYFYITDRLKELIKYKGYQVPPAELEAVILTHPAVADCGVIGLPDLEAGELPHAWVVLKHGAEATETDIMEFVKGKVAQFRRLRGGVRFVELIPKSPSGKILRREMRGKVKQARL